MNNRNSIELDSILKYCSYTVSLTVFEEILRVGNNSVMILSFNSRTVLLQSISIDLDIVTLDGS